jgi:hypothetical protein
MMVGTVCCFFGGGGIGIRSCGISWVAGEVQRTGPQS